jgi:putative Holliday junction resolvase
MTSSKTFIGLDVGEKRIGVSIADTSVRIAIAYDTIEVDGKEIEVIKQIISDQQASVVVIGLPRNQQGEETAQSRVSRQFADALTDINATIEFQDESLTSVLAEKQLADQKKPYTKADIDATAAALILQDYLERH